MRRTSSKNKYPVKSLVKALRILDVLAANPIGCGITDLAQKLRIGKSTVHRLLATLKEEGYVVPHPANSRYMLGIKIAELGRHLSKQYPLLIFSAPILHHLASEYNETVNLAVLEGTEMVYIAGEESRELLRSHFVLGYRAPAHSTALGKVCLADLSDNEIRSRYRRVRRLAQVGPRTISTLDRLLKEISLVRKAGLAYDDEESGSGVYCIAAPIRGSSGRFIAGISFSMPKPRMSQTRKLVLQDVLLRASAQLSQSLGFVAEKVGGGLIPAMQAPRFQSKL